MTVRLLGVVTFASAQLREFDGEPRSQQPLHIHTCSAPLCIRRVIYPQRLNGEPYLAGLIKLFSQTREVVRSPGPGIRARSTAIFCLQPEQHSLLDAADAKIDEAAYAAAATPSRTGHPSTTTACRPQA